MKVIVHSHWSWKRPTKIDWGNWEVWRQEIKTYRNAREKPTPNKRGWLLININYINIHYKMNVYLTMQSGTIQHISPYNIYGMHLLLLLPFFIILLLMCKIIFKQNLNIYMYNSFSLVVLFIHLFLAAQLLKITAVWT